MNRNVVLRQARSSAFAALQSKRPATRGASRQGMRISGSDWLEIQPARVAPGSRGAGSVVEERIAEAFGADLPHIEHDTRRPPARCHPDGDGDALQLLEVIRREAADRRCR